VQYPIQGNLHKLDLQNYNDFREPSNFEESDRMYKSWGTHFLWFPRPSNWLC